MGCASCSLHTAKELVTLPEGVQEEQTEEIRYWKMAGQNTML